MYYKCSSAARHVTKACRTSLVPAGTCARARDNTVLVQSSLRGQLQATRCFSSTLKYRLIGGDEPFETKMHGSISCELLNSNGSSIRIPIRASYPHKPKAIKNLLNPKNGLPQLLTEVGMPFDPIRSFSTQGWDLDEHGDAIHRYLEIRDLVKRQRVLAKIHESAKSLYHDPHVYVSSDGCVTITCTTHNPPGLSMKDVHLARAINCIMDEVDNEKQLPLADSHSSTRGSGSEADILTLRQRGREQNRAAIEEAKKSCNCG